MFILKYKGKMYLKNKVNNELFTRYTKPYNSEDEIIVDIATGNIIYAYEEVIKYEIVPITDCPDKITGIIGKDINIIDLVTKYEGRKATIIFE